MFLFINAMYTYIINNPITRPYSSIYFLYKYIVFFFFLFPDTSCRSRLATLNEKLTQLERRVEYIEARVINYRQTCTCTCSTFVVTASVL